MEKPLITSLGNPLIKQVRALHQKKARAESGLFLVEGIHHVGEAVSAGWEIDAVLYAPDLLTSTFARDLIDQLNSAGSAARGPQPVSAQVMESLAGKENPQGIVAVVRQRKNDAAAWRSTNQHSHRAVALVSPQDAGNVGTILRTLDAVGIDLLFLLDGGVELYHPTVIRSSMGTIFWKQVIQTSFDQFCQWARENYYQLIGTSAHGDMEFQTFVPYTSWVLVLGNEQKGLSAEQIKVCDVTVSLPMRGRVSSLNLSVAAGILLYQLTQPAAE